MIVTSPVLVVHIIAPVLAPLLRGPEKIWHGLLAPACLTRTCASPAHFLPHRTALLGFPCYTACMTPKLSDERRRAIEQRPGIPVYVVDTVGHQKSVLVTLATGFFCMQEQPVRFSFRGRSFR